MRIVSLLPSITEILAALNRTDQLVGRSHECNFPDAVASLPSCTEPKFQADGTSYEIDQRVNALLQEGLSVYRVDSAQLRRLDPNIILTQDHCEVCAASLNEVQQAAAQSLGDHVEVVSVSPTDLSSVVDSIRTIGRTVNAEAEAEKLMAEMKQSLQNIQEQTLPLRRPDVLCLEWLDPLMSAGNWMPEIVQLAGGNPLAATAGKHSPKLQWERVLRLNPDIITITPCGYGIEDTLDEIAALTDRPGWNNLRAVRNHQVFVMDGNHYFNRPGPRLVDSTQILAEILHPSRFRHDSDHPGWINLYEHQFQQRISHYV